MVWINCSMSNPPREGTYTCLVDIDGFGTLAETHGCKFNGKDWTWESSGAQFTTHWKATQEEYDQISKKWEV